MKSSTSSGNITNMNKLPSIDEKLTKYSNQSSDNQFLKASDSQQLKLLPNINNNNNLTTSYISKESTMVVKSSSSHQVHPQLPNEWTSQRVNPIQDNDDLQLTKLEWENQIAKHILSLFASSKALKNIKEGNALLEFVETSKGPKQNINIDQIPSFKTENENTNLEDRNNNHVESIKKITKKRKKLKKTKQSNEIDITNNNNTNDRNKSKQQINNSKSFKIVEDIILRLRNESNTSITTNNNTTNTTTSTVKGNGKQHRITNTIKTKDGTEVVVRGTPRCFPVWFVSSGDVYSDWTMLPGKLKLQAHLNVLYENKSYNEYLSIVEVSIVDVWRKQLYGEEDYTIGSFGISSSSSSNINNNNSSKQKKASLEKAQHHQQLKQTATSKDNQQFGGEALEWEYAGEEDGMIPKMMTSTSLSNNNTNNNTTSINNSTDMFSNKESIHNSNNDLSEEVLLKLWKQLIYTAIAMGILSIEQKQLDEGMSMFKRAETWASNDDLIQSRLLRKELKAHCKDAIAYYFFRKGKSYSALAYSEEALELYEEVNEMEGVSTCLLHIAAVYSQVGNFKEAHKVSSCHYYSIIILYH